MLSKSQISLITSLQHKKFRRQHGLFIVEGIKSIVEFIHSTYQVQSIFATSNAAPKLGKIPDNIKFEMVSDTEFSKITQLNTPQGALALVQLPISDVISQHDLKNSHTIVLDDIQDPGNLGTIIRTAEWFGFNTIICSLGTVDAFNPKVVQATMGSISRIRIVYTDLPAFLSEVKIKTFGALLEGNSIYETDFGKEGLIIMGNEGNGIRPELIPKIHQRVTIPAYGKAESLNVAIATTVFCSEIVRKKKTE